MRSKLISLALTFNCLLSVQAQQNAWHYSTVRFPINSNDSAFLVNTTLRLWKTTRADQAVTFYESVLDYQRYGRFRSKHSLAAREDLLNDSIVSRVHFYSAAELVTAWNSAADTFHVLSLEPVTSRTFGRDRVANDTASWVDVSLYYYPFYLEPGNMKRIHAMLLSALAKKLGATLQGDTLFRTIEFVPDSNEYLPQASYFHLAWFLTNALLRNEIQAFHTTTMKKPMTKDDIDTTLSWWEDVEVEGGDLPGNYTIPVRRDEVPVSIAVHEKWIPDGTDTLHEKGGINYYWVPVYQHYHREVMAYGVRYTNGKVLWHPAVQVDTYVGQTKFNWYPYEESFRAERFQTMHIALEP